MTHFNPDGRQGTRTLRVREAGARRWLAAALLLITCILPAASLAAPRTWENTGTTFSTGGNWIGGTAPADNLTADIGVFANPVVTNNPIFTGNREINGLQFNSGTAGWTFTGGGGGGGTRTLSIGSSGIVNNSTNTQTFSATRLALEVGASQSWSASSGAISVAGAVDLNNFTLTLTGAAGGSVISGAISGTGSIVKTGSGTWTLSGANTYTGTTSIGTSGGADGGTLVLGANNVIPGTAVNVFAGTLDVNTRTDTIGSLSLGGGASGTTAQVIIAAGGVLTLGGTVTYNAANNPNGAIISGVGTLALGADRTFDVADSSAAAEDLAILTSITGANAVTKTGSGALVLSGSNAYTGATAVNAGVLNIRANNALGTTAGGTTVASGAALELQDNITVTNEALSLAGTGVGGNGALRNISGTNTWTGTTTLTAAAEIQSDAGQLNVSGNVTSTNLGLTVDGAGNTAVSGVVGLGSGGLTKNGAGTLFLTGSNTYTGATAINTGVVNLGNNRGLGATNNGTTVASGAALQLQGNISVTNEALSLAGTGVGGNGALRNVSGTNTWTGPITLAAPAEIQTDAGQLNVSGSITSSNHALTVDGAANTTLSGALALGTANVTKTGTGTLTISGGNSSGGNLNILGGVLQVAANTNLGTGGVNIDGGTLKTTATMAITPNTRTVNIGTNGGTIEVDPNTTLTYEGFMSGTGKLTKTGTGTFSTGQLAGFNVAASIGGVATSGSGSPSYFNFDQLTVGATNTSLTVNSSFGPSNSFSLSLTGNAGVRTGSVAGQWAAPWLSGGNGAGFGTNGSTQTNGVDTTPYLNTGSSTSSSVTINLSQPAQYFGILWGSVDASNSLTFYDATNGFLFTVTGQDVLNSPNGDQGTNGTVYANINSSTPFSRIVATAPTPSFEFDNVATSTNSGRTGPVDVLEGTFQVINNGFFNNFSGSDDVFVASGATLRFNGFTNMTQQTIGNLSGAGSVIQQGSNALNLRINAFSNSTFSGTISDTNSNLNLVKLGSGTQTLSGNNTYNGTTIISNGVLRIGDGGTNGTLGRGAVTNLSGLVIDRGGTYTISNNIAGTGGLTNAGAGTVTLTGSNTLSGPTRVSGGTLVLSNTSGGQAAGGTSSIQVDSGATLALGADNQIGNSTSLILNGGTFRVGTDTAGYSDTLGTLTLNANSTIDLGSFTGPHSITFANSSAITWAPGAVLTITNWQGLAQNSGDAGRIFFGTNGLTSTQLAQVVWASQGISGAALLGSNGELTPIPEARVVWGAVALALAVCFKERRRLRRLFRG